MEPLELTIPSADGRSTHAHLYRGGHQALIVLVHGFFNNKETLLFRRMAELLSERFDVLGVDMRGHGKTRGLFTWTAREPDDLAAVVAHARAEGYGPIGLLGFSLGAAVSIIEAARDPAIASVAACAAPCDLWEIDFHFWERDMLQDLKLNLGPKGRGKRVLVGHPFGHKVRPIDVVGRIAPRPVLLLHGTEDWLVKPHHSRRLFEAAREPRKLLLFPGAGHAERIFDAQPEEFMAAVTSWFAETLR